MRTVPEYTEKKQEKTYYDMLETQRFLSEQFVEKWKKKKKNLQLPVQLPSIEGNSTSHSILKQPHETRNNSVSTAMILIWKYFE